MKVGRGVGAVLDAGCVDIACSLPVQSNSELFRGHFRTSWVRHEYTFAGFDR
jgi:hypothetical protein